MNPHQNPMRVPGMVRLPLTQLEKAALTAAIHKQVAELEYADLMARLNVKVK